jgi:hypothetical protein
MFNKAVLRTATSTLWYGLLSLTVVIARVQKKTIREHFLTYIIHRFLIVGW